MHLSLVVTLAFAPNLDALGSDSYAVREAESRRLDNPVSVSLLPQSTDNPEVNDRIARLRKRHKPPTQLQIELRVMDNDFRRWFDQYFLLDRSGLTDWELFVLFHSDAQKSDIFFKAWPVRKGEWKGWLNGAIWPNEYELWRDHCDLYRGVAPPPRPK